MSYEELVEQSLYDVVDPELGINIVDLGLVYAVSADERNNVIITMTLTTPGCPMHDSITNGVKHRVSQLEDVREVEVNLVWEPEWSPSNMSDLAKELL
ncbi:DUF59 domain-containing protein [Psychrobacillus sp. INOP01]|uniref:metal-sulfur cluster assembly factor n=1 Tax=Psychrobacillus sp. INOP01 TaxID=2829187 RepID=UPI001BAC6D4A|nr:iron-sulfur cluster assembly protein [Psychrobacillus sp. INOP01]QUG42896.1 DUF59 domain-containing protein [Psychrobacillus sp. INOP01]